MKKMNYFLMTILLLSSVTFAQNNIKFNGQTFKYGNFEVPKSFGTDPNQVLLCVFMNELDSVEMYEYSPLYEGEVEIISFTEYKTGNYNDISKYRYVLTQDGYTMVQETGPGLPKSEIPVKSFTMFCIYDMEGGTKHLHNRDRKLHRYFKKIQKRKDQNNE